MRSTIERWKSSKFKMEPRSAITIGAQVGVGSFKKVYKGTFHGIDVAVVMMKQGSISGELKNMIKVSRHISLLHLLACVIDNGADELIITEFAPARRRLSWMHLLKKTDPAMLAPRVTNRPS